MFGIPSVGVSSPAEGSRNVQSYACLPKGYAKPRTYINLIPHKAKLVLTIAAVSAYPLVVIPLLDNGIHALNKAFILLPHRKMWVYKLTSKMVLAA